MSRPLSEHVTDIFLLVARLVAGGFMLVHGIPKLGKFFADEPVKFADPIGIGEIPSLVLAVFAEVLCSALLIVGYKTRLATVPLIITMLVIIFVVHISDGFRKMELPALYLLTYLVIFAFGPGKYSVDRKFK